MDQEKLDSLKWIIEKSNDELDLQLKSEIIEKITQEETLTQNEIYGMLDEIFRLRELVAKMRIEMANWCLPKSDEELRKLTQDDMSRVLNERKAILSQLSENRSKKTTESNESDYGMSLPHNILK